MRQILLDQVRNALLAHQGFFHNEKEIQIYLTKYLIDTEVYENVFFEYYIGIELLPNLIWANTNKLSIDIVVLKDGIYYPLEIKFKTVPQLFPHFVFGTPINVTLEKHGALTIGRYSYWKDIKRMELLAETFENVCRGIVLFVSNDASYRHPPLNFNNGGAQFSIHEGKVVTGNELLDWQGDLAVAHGRPGFTLNHHYNIAWTQMNIENHYYILQ